MHQQKSQPLPRENSRSKSGQVQKFTRPLQNLADRLTTPVLKQSWASSLTPINLLKMLPGHGQDAQNLQDFADTVRRRDVASVGRSQTEGCLGVHLSDHRHHDS